MPCRDYYDDHPEKYFKDVTEPALKKQIAFAESALCQTLADFQRSLIELNAMHNNPLDYIDYVKAGITRKELERWWKPHKKLDAQHREAERLKKIRESALSKLSEEERKVLGVN
jgi:arsenate reductase-like glutaredoxin family protein